MMAGRIRPADRRGFSLGLILCLSMIVAPVTPDTVLRFVGRTALADEKQVPEKGPTLVAPQGPSLMMPMMNSEFGRVLFAIKGCVICHSVNGVGGSAAPRLDAHLMPPFVSPFEFAARMWRGAPAMIVLQEQNLGYQIELTGEELAHIIAFAHDHTEQRRFSADDIPPWIRTLMQPEDLGIDKN